VRVGVDLAKRVYQVHAVDCADAVVLVRSFVPEKFFSGEVYNPDHIPKRKRGQPKSATA
jgi:hypothetical protein